jgi:hypothetical protein
MERHGKQKNRWKPQWWLNWTRFENCSVRWSDAPNSSCVGRSQAALKDKRHRQVKQHLISGSSEILWFCNSKVRTSTASALSESTVRAAVHLMPSFKSYRDAPRFFLHHQMNRHFSGHSAVHLTPVFESYRDTPSGWASAPDKLTVRQSIASVYLLDQLAPMATWLVVRHRMNRHKAKGGPSVHSTVQLSASLFPTASLPC